MVNGSGRNQRGQFITFEGIEGSGKSVQVDLMALHCSNLDIPLVVTREPGGTSFGEKLRSILLESMGPQRTPVAELLLYLADRYQDLAEVIEPAVAEGKLVLCDRYHDATRAYQGRARGIDLKLIDSLAEALAIRKPDLTFLLDLPAQKGLARARERNAQQSSRLGRFEAESIRFHRRVRRAYREFALMEPDRFRIIPADRSPEWIHQRVVSGARPLLNKRYHLGNAEDAVRRFSG